MAFQPHYTYELGVWLKFAFRGLLGLCLVSLALGLLIATVQFTYRLVEFLSNHLFDSAWG